jgi:EpsI family protein
VPVDPSPDVQASLNAIYSQLLARTYVNAQGERVMLSIAYGSDQSGDGSQVHRPEFCYTAQGFQVMANNVGSLLTQYGTLPVRRLLAVQGQRNEPITYWVTVGDKATLPGVERKLSQLAYGLTGKIPDGMLVRVSSISAQNESAYRLQEKFIKDMLQSMDTKDRLRVAGRFGA